MLGVYGCMVARVAGMGLSVADPATLVTLNSLSPSNYDSAKSLGTVLGTIFGTHFFNTKRFKCLKIAHLFSTLQFWKKIQEKDWIGDGHMLTTGSYNFKRLWLCDTPTVL